MKDIWVVSQCIVVFILSYLVNYNKLISLGFFTILSPLHNIITLNISFYIWKYTILRLFDQPQNIIKIPCREIIAHSIYLYFCLLNFIFILDSPSSFHSFLSVYRTCFTHYFSFLTTNCLSFQQMHLFHSSLKFTFAEYTVVSLKQKQKPVAPLLVLHGREIVIPMVSNLR